MVWNKPTTKDTIFVISFLFYFFNPKDFWKIKNLQSPASGDPVMNLASSDFIEQSYNVFGFFLIFQSFHTISYTRLNSTDQNKNQDIL